MKATLKFRGKSISADKWEYGYLIIEPSGRPYIVKGDEQIEVHPSTIGQFIGLFDKKGTEICEGDILSIPYVNPSGVITEEENYRTSVEFKNGAFICQCSYETSKAKDNVSIWCKIGSKQYIPNYGDITEILPETYTTIVGNIHDESTLMDYETDRIIQSL